MFRSVDSRAGRPDSITVLFPEQVGIAFERRPNRAPSRIRTLFVGGRRVLRRSNGAAVPPATLEALGNGNVGGVSSWPAYLRRREARGGEWPRRGGRPMAQFPLDDTDYLGYAIRGGSVVLQTAIKLPDASGMLEWVLCPHQTSLGGETYRGLGWKVRLHALPNAFALHMVEPAAPRRGDWAFQQTWGDFIERRFGSGDPFAVPEGFYGADMQPFYFAGGSNGSVVSFFDRADAPRLEVAEEGSRHMVRSVIPLGEGNPRETPFKFWLASDAPTRTKWDALDRWTAVFDDVAGHYLQQVGHQRTEPVPTTELIMPPTPGHTGWFHAVANQKLADAARLGFAAVVLVPWETDADHAPEEYLRGSQCFGSGNAPWALDVSPVMGGESALQRVKRVAEGFGLKVLWWTSPGHLSNSSPLVVQNPDWIMWTPDGAPETAGYGDVVGMGLHAGYFDYAVQRYQELKNAVGYDGFMVDSFLTFGCSSDARRFQPSPQIDRTLETMGAWWAMGCSDIHIEGCGPFGVSASGYGFELFAFGQPEEQEIAIQKYENIRGREYGLYRYRADTLLEPDSYYRALASKGQISPLDPAFVMALPEWQRALIAQANRDYMAVRDRMEHRRLIADRGRWQGVHWLQSGSPEEVIFSFEFMRVPLPGRFLVQEVTSGVQSVVSGEFHTLPMRTYILRPLPGR